MARSVLGAHDKYRRIKGENVHRLAVGISMQVLCPENVRLRQLYEAALRRWSQAELPSKKSDLSDVSRRLALEVEKKALEERNAANERMVLHEQSCPICNRKHKRKPPETE